MHLKFNLKLKLLIIFLSLILDQSHWWIQGRTSLHHPPPPQWDPILSFLQVCFHRKALTKDVGALPPPTRSPGSAPESNYLASSLDLNQTNLVRRKIVTNVSFANVSIVTVKFYICVVSRSLNN